MATTTLLPPRWIRTLRAIDLPGRAVVLGSAAELAAVVGSISAPLFAVGWFRSPEVHLHDLAWIWAGACAVWLLGAALLRPFDTAGAVRGRAEEAVSVSLLVGGVVVWIKVVQTVAPHVGAVPPALGVLFLLLPASLAIRFALVRPLVRRLGIREEAVIVGTGRLAEATAQMLRERGRLSVHGHLSLPHDPAHSLRALGSSTDLERILR